MLSARPLVNVFGVNSFDVAQSVAVNKGDAFTFDFQVIDKDQWPAHQAYNPSGLRYIPDTGATLSVEVININPANSFTRVCSNPFAGDRSIWRASFLSTDPIPAGTVSIKFVLTEGPLVRSFALAGILRVSGSLEVC